MVGDRVYTGQELGAVGDTGNARGCHLHFEEWTAPAGTTAGVRSTRCPTSSAGTGRARRAVTTERMAIKAPRCGYSHSIVLGGFDEMSSATRFTCGISLMIRLETFSRRS